MMTEESQGGRIFQEVRTLEEGQNYMVDIVKQVEEARRRCDLLHTWGTVPRETLERSYRNLSVRYGRALGALTTLMHCRVLTDDAYNGLRARIDMAMVPKVVEVGGRFNDERA